VMRTSDSSRARTRVPNLEKLRLGRSSLGAGGASSVRIFDPPANSGRGRTAGFGRVALASALSRRDRPTLCRRLRAGGWDIEQGSCLGLRRMASDFESDSRSAFLARWQPEPARLMRTNRSGPQKICKRVTGLRSEEVLGYEPDRAPPCHITWGWCGELTVRRPRVPRRSYFIVRTTVLCLMLAPGLGRQQLVRSHSLIR